MITSGSLELSICEDPFFVLNNTQWIILKDIELEMGAHAGLQIIDSNHIQLDNCSIHGFAREGIVMIGGNNNTVSSCEIYDLGRGAIKVSGGNRVTLEKSIFRIENCHIHHLSRIDRTYTPGIWVDGVGTTISHCNTHDVASSAMRINGNDHLVEYNEMCHVVTESDDQGAIDMWGDPTYRGNVFRYNYIHDVGPPGEDEINTYSSHLSIRAGIRFDDAISGNMVYGNVFRKCSGGLFGAIQIHGGKENLIRNNIFYQCTAGISFTQWNKERWIGFMKKFDVFPEQNRKLYTAHYPELTRLFEDINKNTVIQNIFLKCDSITLRQPEAVVWRDNISKINKNSDIADIKNNNYSLENISEDVKKIGFKHIPFEKIGLKRKLRN